MMESLPNASFTRNLRLALQNLFDPAELRRNPLLGILGLQQEQDPPSALRRLLLETIRTMRPGPDVPVHSAAWRTYHILSQRYAEQFTQQEIADDLSLSIRQLRRYESRAVRALAEHLWCRHNIDVRNLPERDSSTAGDPGQQAEKEGAPSREEELEWLRKSFPSERAEVDELVEAALRTIAPLTQGSGVRVSYHIPNDLATLAVQLAPIRQALLNVLAAAVRCAPGGRVLIEAEATGRNVLIRVCPCRPQRTPMTLSEEDAESLEMARQLVRLAGGALDLLPGDGKQRPFSASLTLSAAEQVPVLVIDDNADTLQLFRRYLAGTRYRFVGISDPQRVLAIEEEPAPSIIVLDVMLPGVDGWELLGRLREHPRTHGKPIIVCTILPQEDLALALGAAAFLRKPVSRQSLLSTLDQQLEQPARESS